MNALVELISPLVFLVTITLVSTLLFRYSWWKYENAIDLEKIQWLKVLTAVLMLLLPIGAFMLARQWWPDTNDGLKIAGIVLAWAVPILRHLDSQRKNGLATELAQTTDLGQLVAHRRAMEASARKKLNM